MTGTSSNDTHRFGDPAAAATTPGGPAARVPWRVRTAPARVLGLAPAPGPGDGDAVATLQQRAAARLAAEGRADADPVAPNATPEGRERNRRIDIVLPGVP